MAVARTGANFAQGYSRPEQWSMKLQKKYYNESLIAKVCNNDWEGEIKKAGQLVHIRKRPDVAVQDYVVNQPVNWQDVADNQITFTVDYAKSASVKMDVVDIAQADINYLKELETEIAMRQMNAEDSTLFGAIYSSATTTVTDSAALDPLESGAGNYIIRRIAKLATAMNKLAVPLENRALVVHPDVYELLVTSSAARFDTSGEVNNIGKYGKLGVKLQGFDIYWSNYIVGAGTSGSPYKCVAMQKDAVSFARQVTETQVGIDLQDYYGKGIKSLNVFGFKATQPDGLVLWNARIS